MRFMQIIFPRRCIPFLHILGQKTELCSMKLYTFFLKLTYIQYVTYYSKSCRKLLYLLYLKRPLTISLIFWKLWMINSYLCLMNSNFYHIVLQIQKGNNIQYMYVQITLSITDIFFTLFTITTRTWNICSSSSIPQIIILGPIQSIWNWSFS